MSRFDIPDDELEWRFDTSGGPGGQHANRSATRAVLTFDIASSRAFSDDVRSRLVARLGSEVRIVEGRSRSQTINRNRARRRLDSVLETAAKPAPPPRRRTRPSRAATERRLSRKRQRGEIKQQRRKPSTDD